LHNSVVCSLVSIRVSCAAMSVVLSTELSMFGEVYNGRDGDGRGDSRRCPRRVIKYVCGSVSVVLRLTWRQPKESLMCIIGVRGVCSSARRVVNVRRDVLRTWRRRTRWRSERPPTRIIRIRIIVTRCWTMPSYNLSTPRMMEM